MDNKIITRFPPSPTGALHVGGARTAIYNWLYARANKGKFILRFEDTDRERSTKESEQEILESMQWLGLDYDEGPFYQTKRTEEYQKYADILIKKGLAYYCTCSKEDVESMREKARKEGRKPKYDGACRDKGIEKTKNAVLRIKAPLTGDCVIKDIIKGNIIVPWKEIDDFIIQRSDGGFTYNFAVTIDDLTMGINPVIRGDDHVSNTPKQIAVYHALEEQPPEFGHVPMVLGEDKKRLSKRHGAMSILQYKKKGFLPDGVINYLVRLGWSFGDQEYFSREELIEKFSLKNIGRSPGVFDSEKMLSINAEHIQKSDSGFLAKLIFQDFKVKDHEKLITAVDIYKSRSKTLLELENSIRVYFTDDFEYSPETAKANLKTSSIALLEDFKSKIETSEEFTKETIENAFNFVLKKHEIKFPKLAKPLRVAITGIAHGAEIHETLVLAGRKKSIERINKAVLWIRENRG
ncbi:MAG: glutamate--tRNA ligase [Deltaproteobacteria bacterium]|nr:MAG: glutamate--tRNA ligase [Deltaproteobacteria bacterium]